MTKETFVDLLKTDLEKIALAVEADAGHPIPGLRESLGEVRDGKVGAIHTPESIAKSKAELDARKAQ
ncbi:hypothetical protein [Acidovorax sp. sic0104]|uniref:hypothetical protein n=1 Tax=Acidovorax sp. sic0104 TaxID=2854784 RepID=UPI001C448EFD|nr:hypothetical protein [Acidovorax sp. sic0104]MBV7542141.1 hypothetical protein [Acidovorax sp. sic0104]